VAEWFNAHAWKA